MSDTGRRIFKMETALGVIANQEGAEILDFLGFAISRSVCECCRGGVAPIVKGWLYSQHPDFMKYPFDGSTSLNGWMNDLKNRFGENVSLEPMPQAEVAGIHAMIDEVEKAFQDAKESAAKAQAAEAAQKAAEAEAKALAPFKAKAEDLEKKLAQLEEKNKAAAKDLAEAKAKLAAFDGKVAINENEIKKSIKDILAKTVGSMSFATGGGASAAEGTVAEEAAPASTDSAGAVPDTFGFGASGASDDGFGF